MTMPKPHTHPRRRQTPKAIIFDLDDTILSYDAPGEPCWRETCAHFADAIGMCVDEFYPLIREEADAYWHDAERHRAGRLDLVEARRKIAAAALKRIGRFTEELALGIGRMRTELHEDAIAPFPGAVEAVRALRETGMRLALITNGASSLQRRKLRRYDLESLFESIVIEGEFGVGKPTPRVFLHTLSVLRLEPRDTWMVGDNLHLDIAPAQSLGISGVWHDFRRKGLPAHAEVMPHRIINHVNELL